MAKAKGFIKAASVEKYTETEKGDATAAILGLTEGQPETAPKKRGRKPKKDQQEPEATKRRRGRRPKTNQPEAPAAQTTKREETAPTSTGRTVTITLREGESLNSAVIEAKKKRVQLVFRPSLYDRLKEESERRGVSVNECIHQILEISLP